MSQQQAFVGLLALMAGLVLLAILVAMGSRLARILPLWLLNLVALALVVLVALAGASLLQDRGLLPASLPLPRLPLPWLR